MDLSEYRQIQLDAIAHEEEELRTIESKKIRFFERSASSATDTDITGQIVDRRKRYIETLRKIVQMLDHEIAAGPKH